MTNTQTGSYIALAGLIVLGLSHYGIVVNQDTVVSIIAGVVALYGVIHQFFVTKSVVTAARAVGAVNTKGVKI